MLFFERSSAAMGDQIDFTELVLRGRRFDDHSLPIDTLHELLAYKEILMPLARECWKESFPKRRRVPNGFDNQFRLSLRSIERGSARSVLNLEPCREDIDSSVLEAFLAARGRIEDAIRDPEQAELSDNIRRKFQRFGRTLDEGETIELLRPRQPSGPVYTTEARNRILLPLHEPVTRKMMLSGEAWMIDTKKKVFDVEDEYTGQKTRCTYRDDLEYEIADLVQHHHFMRARFTGVAEVVGDSIKTFDLKELAPFERNVDAMNDLDLKLQEIADQEDGWLHAQAVRASEKAIEAARDLLMVALSYGDIPEPHLYLTPEGGIRAEWDIGSWDISAELEPEGQFVAVHALNTNDCTEHYDTISGRNKGLSLVQFFRKYNFHGRR